MPFLVKAEEGMFVSILLCMGSNNVKSMGLAPETDRLAPGIGATHRSPIFTIALKVTGRKLSLFAQAAQP